MLTKDRPCRSENYCETPLFEKISRPRRKSREASAPLSTALFYLYILSFKVSSLNFSLTEKTFLKPRGNSIVPSSYVHHYSDYMSSNDQICTLTEVPLCNLDKRGRLGYISRAPVATRPTETPVTWNSPVRLDLLEGKAYLRVSGITAKPSATSAITSATSLAPEHTTVKTTTRGYIFTKPVATQTSGTSGALDPPAETSATSAIPSATSLAPEHTTVKTTTRGYIFTKPVATQTSGTSGALDPPAKPATSPGPAVNTPPGGPVPVLEHSLSQSVTVVIIFAVIAAIIGIIVGCASLISLLRRRYREQTSAPKTSEQVEEIDFYIFLTQDFTMHLPEGNISGYFKDTPSNKMTLKMELLSGPSPLSQNPVPFPPLSLSEFQRILEVLNSENDPR
ncbi:hypothetical protein MJT46_013844 [Ovis ammon polii x Ovis aries]|nr:hypothetical protein MJT46_013844 [Ovis ammon polii x Ovis aries]